eukprot:CAMPEP_0206319040 /NCGR_PEP_ID=MMETSP0106_2-20121207/17542_1 /ASSEMBLY_ACC=CAM_ASM_000206 /TAXON_ID=81532 /ORGANISM="Acanthoeca-like sp., Strain 10tr" /LENGTH=33 /DNA_ID= /DNA_START= /DNA_END= /DNA_ORIENTATION=
MQSSCNLARRVGFADVMVSYQSRVIRAEGEHER